MSVTITSVKPTERRMVKPHAGEVKFTRQQYEYLNRIFPELIGNANTTEAELRVQQGQRRVVQHIKERVDGGQIL